MKLTLVNVMTALEHLLKVYTQPKCAPESPHDFAKLYYDVCRDLPREAFEYAIDAYLKTDARYFPKPGELCALAKQFVPTRSFNGGGLVTKYWAWEGNGKADGEPCPVCDAKLEPHLKRVTPDGYKVERVYVEHDRHQHAAKGVGFVGRARDDGVSPL